MTGPFFEYLTGNGFALRCAHYYPWGEREVAALSRIRGAPDNNCVYVKADFVDRFFTSAAVPEEPFTLVTHNSDAAIGEECHRHLDDPNLQLWLAQNVALDHPKLKSLPVGIANANYPHGDARVLDEVRAAAIPKTRLVHAAYTVGTETDGSRARCRQATGIEPDPPKPFAAYLRDLAGSYFCLSPRGRGIDCHRTWEALYLRTIPIVERSLLWRDHADLPHIALDRWEDFQKLDLTPALYEKVWNRFNPSALHMDAYCARLRSRYRVGL